MKRIRMLALFLLSALLLTPAVSAEAGVNVLLSWTDDPATTMTFAWEQGSDYSSQVQAVTQTEYVKSGFEKAESFPAECRDISLDGTGLWHCEVTARGLEPNTVYAYRVGSGEQWSETKTFATSDTGGTELTFAFLGDPQTDGNTEQDYAVWGALLESMRAENPELAFAVLGGDNVNSGISVYEFELMTENASRVFSEVPVFTTVGNHESNFIGGKAELLLDWFALPENGPEGFKEEIYSFDVANCHVLVLNSWIFSGEQPLTEADYTRVGSWIAADLAMSTADWQVVILHVPAYPVHSDTTANKVNENWVPIFEKYGVDLVFEGHQHVYSRSNPMYENMVDYEKGITYIMGVSGSKGYGSADESFAARTVYGVPSYQLVRIDGGMLTVRSLDVDGNELDFVTIPQRGVSVTRGEYVETLWKAAGSPTTQCASPFSDTTAQSAVWASEKGIIFGVGDGRFAPDEAISEGQIELILGRMGGKT